MIGILTKRSDEGGDVMPEAELGVMSPRANAKD